LTHALLDERRGSPSLSTNGLPSARVAGQPIASSTRVEGADLRRCPDVLAAPGSDVVAFLSLDEAIYARAGAYVATKDGGPRLDLNDTDRRYLQGASQHEPTSIMKTGGVGPANALAKDSRRLYWGTIGWPNVAVPNLLNESSDHGGSVVSLPREVTAGAASPVGFAFPEELEALRKDGTHKTGTDLPSGLFLELIVEFAPTGCGSGEPYGLNLLGDGSEAAGRGEPETPRRAPRRPPQAPRAYNSPANDDAVQLYFDPTRCEMNGRAVNLTANASLQLHVFIDLGFVDFVANGQQNGFGYRKDASQSTSVHSVFGDVAVASVESWELERVNP